MKVEEGRGQYILYFFFHDFFIFSRYSQTYIYYLWLIFLVQLKVNIYSIHIYIYYMILQFFSCLLNINSLTNIIKKIFIFYILVILLILSACVKSKSFSYRISESFHSRSILSERKGECA